MSEECIFCNDESIFEQDFSQPEKITSANIRAKGQFWLDKTKNNLVQSGDFPNRKVGKYHQIEIPKQYLAPRWKGFTIELLGICLDEDPPTASVYYPLFFRTHSIIPTYNAPSGSITIDECAEWATEVGLAFNKVSDQLITFGGGTKPQKVREDIAVNIERDYVFYSAAKINHDETGLLIKLHLWPSHGLVFSVNDFNFFDDKSFKILKDALAIFTPGRGKPSEHFNDLREFDDVLRSTIVNQSKNNRSLKQEAIAQEMCGRDFHARMLRKWLKKTTWLHFKWPEIVAAVLEDFNKKN